ncbi:actin family [Pelomyxa schiedti]|nr:actin family [Pelomyxa schiedti]
MGDPYGVASMHNINNNRAMVPMGEGGYGQLGGTGLPQQQHQRNDDDVKRDVQELVKEFPDMGQSLIMDMRREQPSMPVLKSELLAMRRPQNPISSHDPKVDSFAPQHLLNAVSPRDIPPTPYIQQAPRSNSPRALSPPVASPPAHTLAATTLPPRSVSPSNAVVSFPPAFHPSQSYQSPQNLQLPTCINYVPSRPHPKHPKPTPVTTPNIMPQPRVIPTNCTSTSPLLSPPTSIPPAPSQNMSVTPYIQPAITFPPVTNPTPPRNYPSASNAPAVQPHVAPTVTSPTASFHETRPPSKPEVSGIASLPNLSSFPEFHKVRPAILSPPQPRENQPNNHQPASVQVNQYTQRSPTPPKSPQPLRNPSENTPSLHYPSHTPNPIVPGAPKLLLGGSSQYHMFTEPINAPTQPPICSPRHETNTTNQLPCETALTKSTFSLGSCCTHLRLPSEFKRTTTLTVQQATRLRSLISSTTLEVSVVVIDNGSSTIKFGYAGHDQPAGQFSSLTSRSDKLNSLPMPTLDRGRISDWGSMNKLWTSTFSALHTEPSKNLLLLTDMPLGKEREQIATEWFETHSIAGLYIASQGVLSLLCSGRPTGLAVESGYGATYFVPVYDGMMLRHGVKRLEVGGKDLTDYFQRLLTQRTRIDRTSENYCAINKAKEELCSVSRSKEDIEFSEETFLLPDGKVVPLGPSKHKVTEALFTPSLLESFNVFGLHQHIQFSIRDCDPELEADLYQNIVLGGGNCMFRNLDTRLTSELSKLTPAPKVSPRVTFDQSKCKISTWLGASILGSMGDFLDKVILKQDYDEKGGAVAHKFF